jgi:DNA primase
MILDHSIDELRDTVNIRSIVGDYVELKKQGANYFGSCPFHTEKSSSFSVSESRNIYKCFGCGEGGDAIKFYMKIENCDFPTAVRSIADKVNFTLEESEQTIDPEAAKQKATLFDIMEQTAKVFQNKLLDLPINHPAIIELTDNRKLTTDSIIDFQLGFAPGEAHRRMLSEVLTATGYREKGIELGIINEKNANTYDVYQKRIIFPIHSEKGNVLGFGGRKLEDNNKENPKFINSKETALYKKDQILYGLYQAQQHIRKMGYALLVEGYMDVISCHQTGAPNTVATCGTSLTLGHAKKLKRYTNNIVIMRDGDAAGQKAMLRDIDILLEEGFKVEVVILPGEHDPDSFARELNDQPNLTEETV